MNCSATCAVKAIWIGQCKGLNACITLGFILDDVQGITLTPLNIKAVPYTIIKHKHVAMNWSMWI